MTPSCAFDAAADLTLAIKRRVREMRGLPRNRHRRNLRKYILSVAEYRDFFLSKTEVCQ